MGLGAFAGPLLICVYVAHGYSAPPDGLRDSKKLTHRHRKTLVPKLIDLSMDFSIGRVSAEEINKMYREYGDGATMPLAWKTACRRAINGLSVVPQWLYIDGDNGLDFTPLWLQNEIVAPKLDDLVWQVSAAANIAKWTRDLDMIEMADEYPEYGLESNKGYGSPQHIEALDLNGPTPEHRTQYIRRYV